MTKQQKIKDLVLLVLHFKVIEKYAFSLSCL